MSKNFGPNKFEAAAVAAAAAIAGGTLSSAAEAKAPPKPPPKVHTLSKDEQLQRASDIASRLIGVSKSELKGDNLREVSQLPGYHDKVSPETRSELSSATLELMTKSKIDSGPYQPLCTATKVAFHGHPYVLTAAHCLTGSANVDFGQFDGWPAQNIINTTSNLYAVTIAGDGYPIAVADGISYDIPGNDDFALLSVQPEIKGGGDLSQFDELPAVDLSKLKSLPRLGSEVALYSDPAANNSMPVKETGRFLGIITPDLKNNSTPHQFAIVGIDPKDPFHDACNYGSSGSMAIGSNGYLFGPLSMRENIGYASGIPNTMGNENPKDGLHWRIQTIEKELGIDTSSFATLCYYQILKHNADEQKDTMNSLILGLGHFAPAGNGMK